MPAFQPGLVHTPVTPFTPQGRVDLDRLGKLLDFHIANGADALALPTHAGESVSLTDSEKRALIEFAVKHVGGRVGRREEIAVHPFEVAINLLLADDPFDGIDRRGVAFGREFGAFLAV